jgi:hypothetical protein
MGLICIIGVSSVSFDFTGHVKDCYESVGIQALQSQPTASAADIQPGIRLELTSSKSKTI